MHIFCFPLPHNATMAGLGGPPKFDDDMRASPPECWLVLDRSGTELSFVVSYLNNRKLAIVHSNHMTRPVKVPASDPYFDVNSLEGTPDFVAMCNHTSVHDLGFGDATHLTFLWLLMGGNDVLDVARAERECGSGSDVHVINILPWHEALDSDGGMTKNTKQKLLVSYTRDALRMKLTLARSNLEIMIKMHENFPDEHVIGDSVVEKAKADVEELARKYAQIEGLLDEVQGRIEEEAV